MSLSSRFAIAVHALGVLALSPERDVTSSFVATSLNTNPVVARRILASLKAAGLVRSREGAEGGYRLALSAEAIRLDAVYAAVEPEPLFAGHPAEPSQKCPVGRGIQGVLETIAADAEKALRAELHRRTLADVVAATARSGGASPVG